METKTANLKGQEILGSGKRSSDQEILNSTYWFVAGIGAVKQTVLEDKRFTLALEKFEEGK